MKNSIESMLKHPIKSAIVIGAILGGVAKIIKEVSNICEACKSND